MRILIVSSALVLAATSQATTLFYVEEDSDTLRSLDTATLVVTTIGSVGTDVSFGDLAYDATSGQMFLLGGRDNDSLYTVNLATGAATSVGSHGVEDLFSLGATPGGRLFAQGNVNNGGYGVYSLDKSTGASTLVGTNDVYSGGYTYDPVSGRMILLSAGGGAVSSVDLGTGTASLIASPGNVDDNDIAYDASTGGYWAMDYRGNLYSYDAVFNRTLAGTGFGNVASVEVAPVPEPASMAALALGALGLLRRRAKRA